MRELGVFYFMARPDFQLLRNLPSSNKGWKTLFFYAHLPDPLYETVQWTTEPSHLWDFQQSQRECSFVATKEALWGHYYDIRRLLNDHLLGFFKFSHFVSNDATLIVNTSGDPPFLHMYC